MEQTSDADEFSIGIAAGNQLVLTDPTVSRHQCAIQAAPVGFQIRDLHSTNGTIVSGVRVELAYLQHGDTIEIGSSVLRFELLDAEIAVPVSKDDHFEGILGASTAMRSIFATIERIATSDSNVLIEGETGTGKTLIAEVIHEHSKRADKPFVVVDCGAIPSSLIESELFGHEKGAFTGAHMTRVGSFEAALGGTVFLDEIGELPLRMQPKLLRALDRRTIKRIGSTTPIDLDLRVIAATNRDLREAVNTQSFRADLYYRLNTIRMHIPPLRERREDIPLLIEHFYSQLSPDDAPEPPAEMIEHFYWKPWPGNVRELRSAVERVILLDDPNDPTLGLSADPAGAPADSDTLAMVDRFDPSLSYRAAKERAVARFECWFVSQLIKHNDDNLSRAARAARMDRTYLRELLRRHDLWKPGKP